MKEMKVWPHLTIVAVICALVAGVGVGLWMKNRQTAEAESVLTAGRIQRVDGDVAVATALTGNGSDSQWYNAEANTPFSVGDRIYTNDNSHTSLAFSGRNYARLYPNTSVDVLALDRSRTQLALRDGSALFDVGYLAPGQIFEVGTPRGAVNFYEPGLYDVGIGNDGNVLISVLSGLAQVVGLGGTGRISKGELLTLAGQTAAEIVLSRINGRDAGYLIDDYYGYQYPQYYDGRYIDYNTYLNDPYYFDPYRRNVSYQYASPYIPGLNDLDYYGNWQNVNGYGYAWTPRVDNGWSPYQQGYWINDYPYGPTWVSTEPWGYAPYHYGRWAFVGDRWYWVPDGVNTSPTYSPALVAFVPTTAQNEIGWVPLAPGDPYVARYYDERWNPYYLSNSDITPSSVVNLGVPGAIAVAPIDQFVRGYDGGRFTRWDRDRVSTSSVVLDPLLLTPLRNAVIHSAWGRGKKDLPPGIAKKLDQQVLVSSAPNDLPIRRDFARRFGVRTISEKDQKKQFKVRDERPNKEAGRFVRERERVDNDSSGDKQLRQELKRASKIERQAERSNQPQVRAEGVRVANPAVERRINEIRTQQQTRRVERSVGRPDKHQDKPRGERLRQPAPPAIQRQNRPVVQQQARPQPVQQQQQLRVKPGNGGGGWKARAEQQPQGGGQPARVEQKQQGGGKHGGPPAAAPSQGGGGGKGKGKGKGN